ncbi:condensation domain-containing protein [Geminocystis sp. GBBB08]|uniref:non-ribosomal peptide synthetase n=1 Tax=Geminocystis sp. GBBB08 TaxID=2604140 RepID=UPI0027E2B8F1|nr:condensation domain-containing protein [Geminocystis sp. GBBB08]MBL1210748.1 AMP-binding protein [Geminocystis sp. GBBB08]
MRQSCKFSLSNLQQGILFHSLYEENKGLYVEQIVGDLTEKIDRDLFTQTWQQIINRHDILRTSFIWENVEQPQQIINEVINFNLNTQDWSHLSLEKIQQKFEQFLKEDREKGFNLQQAPLMNLSLFKLEENHYKMLWTFHHILLDGRSFTLILKEVFNLYSAKLNQENLNLSEPIPYQNYINWLQEQDLQKAQDFWQHQFKNFTNPTNIKIQKFTNQIINNQEKNRETITLSKELTQNLHKFVQENNLTLNTLIQGAWALLLSRYSGDNDIIFGAVRACRHSVKNAESIIGLLINTIPVRIIISPEQNVLSYLNQVRQNWLEIRDFEYTPLAKIQQWINLPANISLFDSLLVFENYQLNEYLQQQGNQWKNRKFQLLEQGHYALNIGAYDGEQLLIKIAYKTDLFEEFIIVKMLGHLQTLLEGMINNPEQKLGNLSILTLKEKQQILIEWNDTKTEYPKNKCIHHLFEEQVIKTPNNIAVVFEEQKLSYQELNEKANQLANYLQKWGVKPETLIGICVEKSLEMIIGILGILKAGGAYVPLDPNYPEERLQYMLEDAQISILLTQKKLGNLGKIEAKNMIKLDQDWELINQENKANLMTNVQSNNLAYIIYTSGSTGKPKGVMVEHHSVVNILLWRINQLECQDFDAFPFTTSISFDLSVIQIFSPLIIGGTVIIIKDLFHFETVIHQEKITFFSASPSTIEQYINNNQLPHKIEALGLGAEKVKSTLIEKLKKLSHIKRIYNSYGPTETTVGATSNLIFSRLKIKENNDV